MKEMRWIDRQMSKVSTKELRAFQCGFEITGMLIILFTLAVQVLGLRVSENLRSELTNMRSEVLVHETQSLVFRLHTAVQAVEMGIVAVARQNLETIKMLRRIETVSLCLRVLAADSRNEVEKTQAVCEASFKEAAELEEAHSRLNIAETPVIKVPRHERLIGPHRVVQVEC